MNENLKFIGAMLSMISVAVGAAWNTRDFADERAKEVLEVFQKTLTHHEGVGHAAMVRKDDYTREMTRIMATLDKIDDKLDRLTRTRRVEPVNE